MPCCRLLCLVHQNASAAVADLSVDSFTFAKRTIYHRPDELIRHAVPRTRHPATNNTPSPSNLSPGSQSPTSQSPLMPGSLSPSNLSPSNQSPVCEPSMEAGLSSAKTDEPMMEADVNNKPMSTESTSCAHKHRLAAATVEQSEQIGGDIRRWKHSIAPGAQLGR